MRAGIEIRLDPGWKTYWRYPGDSGVPPTLDFAGSENIKSVTTLWPAPERFADGAGGNSIGYLGDVVLPLRIVPNDATKPSSLHLKLGYAVCGKLCVPAEADLDLDTVRQGRRRRAGARCCGGARAAAHDARRGQRAGGGLRIASVHREADGEPSTSSSMVAAPDGVPVDLFVEGPTPDWALPLPEPTGPAHRQRAGNTAIHVRPRWAAARRATRRRAAHLHRGFARPTPSRSKPVSTNSPGTR